MNHKLGALLGRILLLLLYCSPLFFANSFTSYCRAALAEELSVQFLKEVYESGLTESAYLAFLKEEAKLGYAVHLQLEGKDRAFSNEEMLSAFPVEIQKDEFLSCELSSDNGTIRTGGH